MKNFEGLKKNIESYLRRFYWLRMVKGITLSAGVILCFFLVATLSEYLLYLTESVRKVLFFSGVLAGIFGLSYYFIHPLMQILKLARRASVEDFAKMIGKHLGGVDDKIVNTLQLGDKLSLDDNTLIFAAIEQKSKELSVYNFKDLLSWRSLTKVALFLCVPVALIVILSMSNEGRLVLGSSERIVRYNEDFNPPPPFDFIIDTTEYLVEHGGDVEIKVSTEGSVQPDEVQAYLGSTAMRLSRMEGFWVLRIENIRENKTLFYEAMGYRSSLISIETYRSPQIVNLDLIIEPPAYTGLEIQRLVYSQTIKILAGSQVRFAFDLMNAESASLISGLDTFKVIEGMLDFSLVETFSYRAEVSNEYKNSSFLNNSRLIAIADKAPEISARYTVFGVDSGKVDVKVEASDDFGLGLMERVQVFQGVERVDLVNLGGSSYYQEVIDLGEFNTGGDYAVFYRVRDNNIITGPSWSRSESFLLKVLSESDRFEKQQRNAALAMESFSQLKKEREELTESLENIDSQNTKKRDWRKSENLKDLLNKLEKQQEVNKQRQEKLIKALKKDLDNKEELKEQLKTLSETERRIEELRKEIEMLLSTNKKEELQEKLKQLKAENKQQSRREERLEDLLKGLLFQRDLLKTIEEYKELADKLKVDKTGDASEKRDDISKDKAKSESLEDKLKVLAEDSKQLKDLLNETEFKEESEALANNLEEAQEAQEEGKESESEESKKEAGDNASEMSEALALMMEGMQAKALEINLQAIRRILENLERYSVDIESYKEKVVELEKGDPGFRELLKKGSVLAGNSKVIMDSLISLSEKAPEIKDKVFKELDKMQSQLKSGQVHLQELELMSAASAGQFSMMAANNLALLLDDAMQSMMSMMASKKKGDQNCEKPGGGKPKPGSMSEKLGKMGKMMDKLEKGSKPGSKGQGVNGRTVGEILSEQEALRQALAEMEKEGGMKNGEAKPISKELDEMEDLLLERNLTEYIERFKRVESRLLESEKADMERKKKEDRLSKSGEGLRMKEGARDDVERKGALQQKDILRFSPILFNPFYQWP
jgi:hypothetical protein